MATQLVRISNEVEIPYLTYQGQPVLTFALIDKVHGRPDGTARRNFNTNKARFIEKEDYFLLSQSDMEAMDEFRTSANPKGILLITESGYLMLVKSFTDDLSWQIQRQLVRLYFRVKAISQSIPGIPALAAHTRRDIQIGNSKAVNQVQVALGGANAAIAYNLKNCTLQSGRTPAEWKTIAKAQGLPAKQRNSAKDVLRVKIPQVACGMSLADQLVAGGATTDDGISIGKDSQPIFQRILALGITPPELLI